MDKSRTTPKDFFLWAGAMVALYAGVSAFISLMFDYINYAFPDSLNGYYGNPFSGSVSYEMAALIVLSPLFLTLMRLIRRDIARDASRGEVWVRRWALYLTMFIAGATIAIDLITLIMYFLNGDLGTRFLLKVLVVLLVAAAGLMHFSADAWGYWSKNPGLAKWVMWAVGALIIFTVGAGFLLFGTPKNQRDYRFDETRVNDLSSIQSSLVYQYYQPKQSLPAGLDDLNNAISGYSVPSDPKTGAAYEYRATGEHSFELCATFDTNSALSPASVYNGPARYAGVSENWQHDAGRVCFERTIDPQLLPPQKSPVFQ